MSPWAPRQPQVLPCTLRKGHPAGTRAAAAEATALPADFPTREAALQGPGAARHPAVSKGCTQRAGGRATGLGAREAWHPSPPWRRPADLREVPCQGERCSAKAIFPGRRRKATQQGRVPRKGLQTECFPLQNRERSEGPLSPLPLSGAEEEKKESKRSNETMSMCNNTRTHTESPKEAKETLLEAIHVLSRSVRSKASKPQQRYLKHHQQKFLKISVGGAGI